MRIAIAANGRMGLGLYRALQSGPHEIVAIVRDGRQSQGLWKPLDMIAGWLAGPWSIEGRALAAGVPSVWLREQTPDELRKLEKLEPDLLLVGNFGLILKGAVLQVPRIGTINTHWSLLPAHRGPHPSTSVLLAGESRTGLTFHVVDERIDAGDILAQFPFPIGPDDTSTSLYHRACTEAEREVAGVIDGIATAGLVGAPQDLAAGSYWKRVTPQRAFLDFTRDAESLDRKVRALVSPMARLKWRERTVYVTSARPIPDVDAPPGTVVAVRPRPVIACGTGGLAIDAAWMAAPPLPWGAPWASIRVGDVVTRPSPK